MTKGRIWIGTSNIVVPGNKKTFPPEYQERSRLHYYSRLFNSLEINSSFYKTPLGSTFQKWSEDVVEKFIFSVKLSKEVTHHKTLQRDEGIIPGFMEAASRMTKKGCLLVQFPGKISLEMFTEVENVLDEMSRYNADDGWRIAVEFRNTSWYAGETVELLREHNATMVLHDIPKSRLTEPIADTDFMYIRYHGPTGNYRDSYTDDFLQKEAKKMRKWAKEGKDVFAYFNNTLGSAYENAQYLKGLVK